MSNEEKFNHLRSFYELYTFFSNNYNVSSVNWDLFQINILLSDNANILCFKLVPGSIFEVHSNMFLVGELPADGQFWPEEKHYNKNSIVKYIRKKEKKLQIIQCPHCQTKFTDN